MILQITVKSGLRVIERFEREHCGDSFPQVFQNILQAIRQRRESRMIKREKMKTYFWIGVSGFETDLEIERFPRAIVTCSHGELSNTRHQMSTDPRLELCITALTVLNLQDTIG